MTAPLILTIGEPAGIGAELALRLLQLELPGPVVIMADIPHLRRVSSQFSLGLEFESYQPTQPPVCHQPGRCVVLSAPLPAPCQLGQLEPDNAAFVLACLKRASLGCLAHEFRGLITGPVHKALLNQVGIRFSGQTEWLAQHTDTPLAVMMLVNQHFKVALATTHLPLQQVPQALTTEHLIQTLTVLHQDLVTRFGIKQPVIDVCGLNPHAGEQGYCGTEEQTQLLPALEFCRQQGMHLRGPLSADTVFLQRQTAPADVILAMYHDQGLPVLKYSDFASGVNVTLGLPFIRVSVDHGTALDIAPLGQADVSSLHAATKLAFDLSERAVNNIH